MILESKILWRWEWAAGFPPAQNGKRAYPSW